MAWIQPFLNWVAGMIPTKDDFNRIEGNTQALKDEITTQTAELEQNKVDKVTGKGLSTNDYTTTEKNKLAGIETGAQKNTVTSVAGKTGAVTLVKGDVGLGSVQNYGIATQAEAEAGTSNVKYMTPLRVKETICASVVYVSGFYAGDGQESKTITLGFTPKAVLVILQDSISSTYDSLSNGLAVAGKPYAPAGKDAISITTGGFVVYQRTSSPYSRTNTLGRVYNYIAFK